MALMQPVLCCSRPTSQRLILMALMQPVCFAGETDQLVFEKLLANEKENFKTLYEKVRDS